MKYSELFDRHAGKRVKVIMTDGEIIRGKLSGYISAEDNDPDPESVIVENIELFTNEIKTIEVSND